MSSQRHVLCTGMHRSGTTWLGRAIEHAHGLRYVHEPSNPVACRKVGSFYFMAESEQALRPPYAFALDELPGHRLGSIAAASASHLWERIVIGRRQQPSVIKDPFAFFNARMLQETYDVEVVLVVRHPVDVVSSILRLKWDFDFRPLLSSDRFRAENERWLDDIAHLPGRDLLSKASLLWVVLHNWWRTSPEAPTDFHLVLHDALTGDPRTVESILPGRGVNFERFGNFISETRTERATPGEEVAHDNLVRSDSELQRPGAARLSQADVSRILSITGDECESWGIRP